MLYLWRIPDSYANKDIGEYDYSCSPSQSKLMLGRKLTSEEFASVPVVNFIIPKARARKIDCLANSSLVPLVSPKLRELIENFAYEDVQFIPAKCICTDGELNEYYFLNVTHLITGIDHEKSIYTKMGNADAIRSFHYLTYKQGCMGVYHLARDKEYDVNLLVNETIKSAFEKERITGVWCVRTEEYYRPLSELL